MSEMTCPLRKRTIPESLGEPRCCPYCDWRLSNLSPDAIRLRQDSELCNVAIGHRRQQWAFLASFLFQTLLVFDSLPTSGPGCPIGLVLLYLVLHLFVGGLMVMLLSAMRRDVIVVALYGLLSMVPIGNLVLMVVVSSQATSYLKKSGVSVGLFGASEEDVRKRIDRSICSCCGYNLTGNTSGRCPECGTAVAGRSPDASRLPPL